MDSESLSKWMAIAGAVLSLALVVLSAIEGCIWLKHGELPNWTLSALVTAPVTSFVGFNKFVDVVIHLQPLWLWVPLAWVDKVMKNVSKARAQKAWRRKVESHIGLR